MELSKWAHWVRPCSSLLSEWMSGVNSDSWVTCTDGAALSWAGWVQSSAGMSTTGCSGEGSLEYLLQNLCLRGQESCPLLKQDNRLLQLEEILVNLFQRLLTHVHGWASQDRSRQQELMWPANPSSCCKILLLFAVLSCCFFLFPSPSSPLCIHC